ncbi:hypothetical protein PTKIN_Ptkin13bG0242100 [Pterospermum kingtungense]
MCSGINLAQFNFSIYCFWLKNKKMTSSYQKQISSLTSTDIIASNDDIIMEILLRLPAKTLLNCKSVSRRWLNLISDPQFVLRHFHQNSQLVSGFILAYVMFCNKPPTHIYVSLDENQDSAQVLAVNLSFDPAGSIMISQSCNGLLLCHRQHGSSYYIFNPATSRFSVLPEPFEAFGHHERRHCYRRTISFFALAYDPTISPFYQAVCVQHFNTSCNIQIYSSETQGWRGVRNLDFGSFSVKFRHGVFWKGGIHWINTDDGNSFRFDIEQERLQAMPRPPLPEHWNSYNFRHFMECQGHLFFIDFECPEYIIYEMEEDCSKWTVKHHLDINLIVSAFPDVKTVKKNSSNSLLELEKLISLVSVVEVKNLGLSLVMYIPGRFISYRFKDDTFKTLRDVMLYEMRFQWYHIFNYMETLSSV